MSVIGVSTLPPLGRVLGKSGPGCSVPERKPVPCGALAVIGVSTLPEVKEIMPERTTISVLRPTKDALASMKRPGQTYDAMIRELVKFRAEKGKEYWTRRRDQRLNSRISART